MYSFWRIFIDFIRAIEIAIFYENWNNSSYKKLDVISNLGLIKIELKMYPFFQNFLFQCSNFLSQNFQKFNRFLITWLLIMHRFSNGFWIEVIGVILLRRWLQNLPWYKMYFWHVLNVGCFESRIVFWGKRSKFINSFMIIQESNSFDARDNKLNSF